MVWKKYKIYYRDDKRIVCLFRSNSMGNVQRKMKQYITIDGYAANRLWVTTSDNVVSYQLGRLELDE